MKYKLNIKPKYKSYAFEDQNITSTNTINEVPTVRSKAFIEGSGPVDTNAENAFKSLSNNVSNKKKKKFVNEY